MNVLLILNAREYHIGFYECIGVTYMGLGLFSATGILKKKGKIKIEGIEYFSSQYYRHLIIISIRQNIQFT